MTSINDWDTAKYDTPEGESERVIKQFSPIPADITDSYYNDQGGIRVTKGDTVVVLQTKGDPYISSNNQVVDDADISLIFSPCHMVDVDRSLKDPAGSESKKKLETVSVDDSTHELPPDPVTDADRSLKNPAGSELKKKLETVSADDSTHESPPDPVVVFDRTNVHYQSKPLE